MNNKNIFFYFNMIAIKILLTTNMDINKNVARCTCGLQNPNKALVMVSNY